MKRLYLPFAIASGVLIILGALAWLLFSRVESRFYPDPVTLADASLSGLREQNRLIVFEASYNATVTTTLSKLGLSARKTLMMPGTVRYELDLSKLQADDVRWDETSKTLSVKLPPIEIAAPQVQMERIQTYDDGGILMALTDAENMLDKSNRKKGVAELAEQAKNPVQMRLARDAGRRAVANSFALPLRAAGLDVKVEAFFEDEAKQINNDRWDLSRPISEIMAEQKAKEEASE